MSANSFDHDAPRWFSRTSTMQLANMQKNQPGGMTPIVRTTVAAHRQFEDIECLLALIPDKVKAKSADITAIAARHENYRALRGD